MDAIRIVVSDINKLVTNLGIVIAIELIDVIPRDAKMLTEILLDRLPRKRIQQLLFLVTSLKTDLRMVLV
jgi:hypothetical protein